MSNVKIGGYRKRDLILSVILLLIILAAALFLLNKPVILQRGNPLPYIKCMLQLNSCRTYRQVNKDDPNLFITKRYDSEDFFRYIENTYQVTYQEQMGSGYLFGSGERSVVVTSEIYWRYYSVWKVSTRSTD